MKTLLVSFACLATLSMTEANSTVSKVENRTNQIAQMDSARYGDYAGKYIVTGLPFESVMVTPVNGQLLYSAGDYKGELKPMPGEDQFDVAGQATLTFARDASKAVAGIKINAQGQDYFGTKDLPKMDMYSGNYKFEGLPFERVILAVKDGKLVYTAGEYQGELTPMAGKDMFNASGQATVKFTRAADNAVSAMVLNTQGEAFTGAKEAAGSMLDGFVGQYKMQGLPFETMDIKTKDGKLIINANGDEGELTPLGEPDLYDAAGRATIKFTRNADKKVTGVSLNAQGMSFEGSKK